MVGVQCAVYLGNGARNVRINRRIKAYFDRGLQKKPHYSAFTVSSVLTHKRSLLGRYEKAAQFAPFLQNRRSLPSLHPAPNTPRRHDLFVSFGPNPTRPTLRTPLPEPRTPLRPYRYGLPSSLPGLRSSTFILADT